MTKQVFQTTFAGRELIVETGQVAKQANGSVVVRYGESTVCLLYTSILLRLQKRQLIQQKSKLMLRLKR